jgi:beta-lactamase family protein
MSKGFRAVVIVICVAWTVAAFGAGVDLRVTLLGTASPSPRPDRFGPSTLIEAGSRKLLVDAGRGVPVRLWQLRIPMGQINALFLTHYHSDHTSGVPDLWLTGWLAPPFGQRKTPFHLIGPVGAKELMANLERAYAADIKIRTEDEKLPPEGVAVQVEEFAADGVAYEKDGVRVTAFEVNHGDAIKPAYGYRVDYRGRSIVISGDTRYNENVVKCTLTDNPALPADLIHVTERGTLKGQECPDLPWTGGTRASRSRSMVRPDPGRLEQVCNAPFVQIPQD